LRFEGDLPPLHFTNSPIAILESAFPNTTLNSPLMRLSYVLFATAAWSFGIEKESEKTFFSDSCGCNNQSLRKKEFLFQCGSFPKFPFVPDWQKL